jgi:electron transport complex protein RnfG
MSSSSQQGHTAKNGIWRSAFSLGMVALMGTTLLAGVHGLTEARIAEQQRKVVLRQLGQLVPPGDYDNAFHEDSFQFTDELHFPQGQTVTAYRARLAERPVAVVLRLAAMNGYNGRIDLLVGIDHDGTVRGVRVAAHKETPGLGDVIELAKSEWVLDFDGRSLTDPRPAGWAVKRDGGEFDQFTGATITPRAVVNAVRLALEYFDAKGELLFTHAPDPVQEPAL